MVKKNKLHKPEKRRDTRDSNASRTVRMNARHDRMAEYIGGREEASVPELARHFNVSVMTIRRDLVLMERAGRLTRTHGGAFLSKQSIVEFAFAERGKEHAAEKRAIAREVAARIEPGMTISLDSGTTTLEVARNIAHVSPLTVLTSSLAIASVLYAHDNIDLVLLGGAVRKGSPDLMGWLTEQNLRQFHVDLAIVGADGVTRDGAFTNAIDLTRVCQAIMAGATRTILVVDHSKFGRASFARFAALNEFAEVFTDAKTPASVHSWLSGSKRKVWYASVR